VRFVRALFRFGPLKQGATWARERFRRGSRGRRLGRFVRLFFTKKPVITQVQFVEQLQAKLVSFFPAGEGEAVALSRQIHGAPESVQLASYPMRILRARSIVFEPHQDVFFQGRRAFRQRLGTGPRWEAVNEGFSSNSELVHWSYRRIAIVSSDAIPQSRLLDSGIIVNGKFPSNYYHWIINILPKVFLVEKEGIVAESVPVLVSASVKGTPAEEALRLVLGGRREVIFIPDEPHYVRDAYVVEAAVPEIAQLSGQRDPAWDTLGGFNFSFMRLYRQFFLDAEKDASLKEKDFSPSRVYLSRSNSVRPFNEHDVRTVLEKHGFVNVKIEDHSFLEQVRIFSRAEIVVSTTGAQWTGALFCSRAKCLIMGPGFLSGSSLFSKLLHVGGGFLFEILMDVEARTWRAYRNSGTAGCVDIGELARAIQELESH